jgi:hypothetical protein
MICLQEKNRKWKILGIIGSILMCFVCKSRLAQLSIILIPLTTAIIARLRQPLMLITLGVVSYLGGIFATSILTAVSDYWEGFKGARAGSTRVRFALKRIAFHRWETEAPIWGHGVVEGGPHLVEYMAIGSHHTWAGVLFVKGLVGFVALAVPMLVTLLDMLRRAASSSYRLGSTGLGVIIILFMYTFGENLEILVYLYWPGMLVMGMALQEKPLPRPPVVL